MLVDSTFFLCERLRPGRLEAYLQVPGPAADTYKVEIGSLNTVILFGGNELVEHAQNTAVTGFRASPPELNPIVHRHGQRDTGPDVAFYELRQYSPRPSEFPVFLDRMLSAMRVREKYSTCSGIWTSESDRPKILHLWGYRSLQHRDDVRAGVAREQVWMSYAEYALQVLDHMTSDLLIPVPPNRPTGKDQ